MVRRHHRYIQGFIVKYRPLLGDDDHAPSHVTEERVAGGDVTSYKLKGLQKYTWYKVTVEPFYQSIIGRGSTDQVRTLDDGMSSFYLHQRGHVVPAVCLSVCLSVYLFVCLSVC